MEHLEDNRHLSPEELTVLRRRSVAAVLKGETQAHVAELLGISQQTLSLWMTAYHQKGEASLVYARRGRKPGGGLLSDEQSKAMREAIVSHMPDALGLAFFLWTRAAVVELAQQKFGVRLSEKTAGEYLRKWDMTPQKPARRAWQQDPAAVQQWLAERYPAIRARAKRDGAMILWLDEMGIRSDDTVGRCYGIKGRTPVVPVSGQRFGCNMISALSNSGTLFFKVYTEKFTAPVMLDFLARVERQMKRPVVIICDGHPVHKSKAVREWLSERDGRMKIELLPPYSPELNPDEFLNNDVKSNAVRRRRPKDQQQLLFNIRAYLQSTQRRPDIVARYFLAEPVRYAASG